jgi:hypothetical protein
VWRGILKHVGKKLKEGTWSTRNRKEDNAEIDFNIVADVEWIRLAQVQGGVAGAAGKLLLSQYRLQPLS